MISRYSFIVFSLILLIFTSCVSKKKFLEMQAGRLSAEEKVRLLTQENKQKAERIEEMIADYEEMRNSLLENNAIKDQYIDSLNAVAYAIGEELSQQKRSLETTSFTLDFEKQRLSDALEERNQTINRLESQIGKLETEISNQQTVIDQKNFDINQLRDRIKTMQTNLDSRDENQASLQQELESLKKRIDSFQTTIREKDETITRLENNVRLLKQELGRN